MKENIPTDSVSVVAVSLLEGLRGFVIAEDLPHHLTGETCLGGEELSGDDVAVYLGEPAFYVVEPGQSTSNSAASSLVGPGDNRPEEV